MSGAGQTGRILLVDDDARFAGLVAQHLRGHGHVVIVAESVAGAEQELVAATSTGDVPDVVLLDINLTDGAGWALLRSDGYVAAGSPPVVVITATAVSPRKLQGPGIAGCLTKPFAMETLRSTIDRVMHPEVSLET